MGWVAADRFPSNVVAIAAALRVDQKSKYGMDAQSLEEIRRGAWGKAASPAFRPLGLLNDLRKNLQFLFFGGGGEAGNAGVKIGCGFLHSFKAFLIDRQRFAEESFQGSVNEVDHACFARAPGCIGRDDAGGQGFNFTGLFGGEDFERWMTGLCGLMGVFGGGNERGPVGGKPGCAGGASEELKKIATCGIERFHVPPVVQTIYELDAAASTRKPGALLLIWPV